MNIRFASFLVLVTYLSMAESLSKAHRYNHDPESLQEAADLERLIAAINHAAPRAVYPWTVAISDDLRTAAEATLQDCWDNTRDEWASSDDPDVLQEDDIVIDFGALIMPDPGGYLCEPETYATLRAIMTRLYDDQPLSGDQRRDLANVMHATLGQFREVKDGGE